MPDLKMLNSTKYPYKLTFIKCSYGPLSIIYSACKRQYRIARQEYDLCMFLRHNIKILAENI